MTSPGSLTPPSPGWWERTNRIGTIDTQFGWDIQATGQADLAGAGSSSYGWASTATGVKPVVQFDAAGAGDYDTAGSLSWSHTAAANSYVVVAIDAYGSASITACTYGGTAMTPLGRKEVSGNIAYGIIAYFGILDAAGGTRTIAATTSVATYCAGSSVSYLNAKAARCVSTTMGSGTSLSHYFPLLYSDGMIVQAFAALNPLTPSGGTNRYNGGSTYAYVSISDATSSTTFTATQTTAQWAGLALVLTTAAPGSLLYVKSTNVSAYGYSGTQDILLPPHVTGDLIVIYGYNQSSNTPPTKPGAGGSVPAWVDIDAPTGADNNSCRTAQFVATGSSHTSGTWTNALGMAAVVLAGQKASGFVSGHAESGSTSTHGATAPAVTLGLTDGTSALLHFFGRQAVQFEWSAAPAGYTRYGAIPGSASYCGVCLDIKDVTTADGAVTNDTDTGGSIGYRGASVEILDH